MPPPYSVASVISVAAGKTTNLLTGLRGRTLLEPSHVRIYANREVVDIEYTVTIGSEAVGQNLPAPINTVAGDTPSTRDDLIVDSFGGAADEIIIDAKNANAAAKEARVIVFVTPIDDNMLARAAGMLGIT